MNEFRIIDNGGLHIHGNHCVIRAPPFTSFVSGKQDAGPCPVSMNFMQWDVCDHYPVHKPWDLGLH